MPNPTVEDLSKLGVRLEHIIRTNETRNHDNFGKLDGLCAGALSQLQGVTDSIKNKDTQIKVLSARCDALGKEVESLKKDGAGMADVAAVKKLVADLNKRVDAMKK